MKEPKLLPCPFCGIRPKGLHSYINIDDSFLRFYVVCKRCKGTVRTEPYKTEAQAIKSWNRRRSK